jgi:hypothetical protein
VCVSVTPKRVYVPAWGPQEATARARDSDGRVAALERFSLHLTKRLRELEEGGQGQGQGQGGLGRGRGEAACVAPRLRMITLLPMSIARWGKKTDIMSLRAAAAWRSPLDRM